MLKELQEFQDSIVEYLEGCEYATHTELKEFFQCSAKELSLTLVKLRRKGRIYYNSQIKAYEMPMPKATRREQKNVFERDILTSIFNPPARPGAMDYKNIPSLINSKELEYV